MNQGAAASENKVRLARVAISNGRTRGQFIREHTGHIPSKPVDQCLAACQTWSDAYTEAMEQLEGETSLNK